MVFPRPEIEITLRSDRMIQGTQRARQEFERLKQTATGTFADMQTRSGQAASAMNQVSTSTKKASINVKGLGLSMVGLTTTTVGVVTSMSNLDRAAARVEKSFIAVRRIEDQIASTRAVLNRLTAAGKTNTEQYAVQVGRLNTALADLEVKQQDVKLAQDAHNDAQILFATMVANTAINSGFLIANLDITRVAMSKLTIRTVTQTGALITYNKVQLLSVAGMKALRVAALEFMATPLGIVLAAASLGFLLFETNVLGVRTELEKLVGVQKGGLSVFGQMGKLFGEQSSQTKTLGTETKSLSSSFSPGLTTAVGSATSSFGSLSTTLGGSIGGTGGGVIGQVRQLNIEITEGQRLLLAQKELTERGKLGIAALFGTSSVDELPGFLREPNTILEQNFELMKKGFEIQQERSRIQKEFNLIQEVELNKAKAIRLVLNEINEDVQIKLDAGKITLQQAERELELRRRIAIEVFKEGKGHEKIAEEQKKSLLPLKDLLESLKNTSSNNPLFGFNGVFSNGAGVSFGGGAGNRFSGFAGGSGSSITIGGQSFRSRVLNPRFGNPLGGDVNNAIRTFIAKSGGFSTAIASDAISQGLLKAVADFSNTRLIRDPVTGEISEQPGFGFRATSGGRVSGAGNFADPFFATGGINPSTGKPDSSGPGTPQHILIRAAQRDTKEKLMRRVFGFSHSLGIPALRDFAAKLQPEAGSLILSTIDNLLNRIDNGTIRASEIGTKRKPGSVALNTAIRRAIDLDRSIRMGFLKNFGRGHRLKDFAREFGGTESAIFDGIRSKYDVVDLEARMFFARREQIAMFG